jgi:hypothetical protein
VLWATEANLVMHYWPLQQIWLCAEHCDEFSRVPWATAANLVMRYSTMRNEVVQ